MMPIDIPPALPSQACIELSVKSDAYGFRIGQSYGSAGRLVAFRCDGFARPSGLFIAEPRYGWSEQIALKHVAAMGTGKECER